MKWPVFSDVTGFWIMFALAAVWLAALVYENEYRLSSVLMGMVVIVYVYRAYISGFGGGEQ